MINDKFSGKKVFVTGASGFIGSRLCHYLVNHGVEVHAVSRKANTSQEQFLHWYQGDLSNWETAKELMEKIRPDLIFHFAGHVLGGRNLDYVIPSLQGNLVTTVNLFTLATQIGCDRLIFPGSLEEPKPDQEPIPVSPYAASKWASSAYAHMFHQLYQLPVVIGRIYMVYGPGSQSPKKLLPYVINSLLQGETPKLSSGTRQIDWIYIDDVIEGLITAALAPDIEGSTLEFGSGSLISIDELVQRVMEVMDVSIPPELGALSDRPREQVRVADVESTYSQIGWKPKTSLTEGLKETVDWYRNS